MRKQHLLAWLIEGGFIIYPRVNNKFYDIYDLVHGDRIFELKIHNTADHIRVSERFVAFRN